MYINSGDSKVQLQVQLLFKRLDEAQVKIYFHYCLWNDKLNFLLNKFEYSAFLKA